MRTNAASWWRLSPVVIVAVSLALAQLAGLQVGMLSPRFAAAEEDAPTGGGTGCQSNGNCQGTLYKDKSNLNKWWYRRCSGCHTVQAPPPPEALGPLTPADRGFLSDHKAFWALHGQAKTDPVLRGLLPKSKLKPVQPLSTEFRALLK